MHFEDLPRKKRRAILRFELPTQRQKARALLTTLPHLQTDEQAPSDPVLVQCAISGRPSNLPFQSMQVELYADLLKVRRAPQRSMSHTRRTSTRGLIRSFSRKSRKRMIERLAMLRSVDHGYFVTLTYPDDVPHSPEKAKRDWAALRHRLARRFPSVGGIWRLELKRRKSGELVGEIAPHFHILIFGWQQREQLVRMWLQLAWSRIVYETDNPPRRVRTRADVISSRKHAARYASKYAAKEEEQDDDPENLRNSQFGRRWGTFGALDCAPAVILIMSALEVVSLRRMCVRWLHARRSKFERRCARGHPYSGFAVLGLGDLSSRTCERMLTA